MKKLFLILLVIGSASCKKNTTQPNKTIPPNTTYSGTYATLSISRSYISYDTLTHTDSILSSSYWSKNGVKKYLPLLPIIAAPGAMQQPGYDDYKDTMQAATGDVITLTLNLKHNSAYGITPGGVFVMLAQTPGSSYLATFMCQADTLTQTISYTVK